MTPRASPSLDIGHISCGADGAHTEDAVAVFDHGAVTDILVIDGATPLAPMNYIDTDAGDVVWFVQHFCTALQAVLHPERSQEDSVVLALAAMRASLKDHVAAAAMPLYASPIAALTWLRLIRHGEGDPLTLHAWCLGDCKTLLRRPDQTVIDLDPYVNPQEAVLRAHIEQLKRDGVSDAGARREHLMPMLRARREAQNTAPAPTVLCLAPRGPFEARSFTLAVKRGSALLGMSDGFYRLVDTYGLHTNATLAEMCLREGLPAAMQQLRAHETAAPRPAAGTGDSHVVKSADDASAMLAQFL